MKKRKIIRKKIIKKKAIIKEDKQEYLKLGVPGFDSLVKSGVPVGMSLLVDGGPGNGKTIFCRKIFYKNVKQNKNRPR